MHKLLLGLLILFVLVALGRIAFSEMRRDVPSDIEFGSAYDEVSTLETPSYLDALTDDEKLSLVKSVIDYCDHNPSECAAARSPAEVEAPRASYLSR